MKKWIESLALGAAISLIGINGAWAGSHASLLVVEGNILVNHGSGFEPAVGMVDLNVGDRILAGENASAVLSYAAAACSISIKAGSVATITKSAPCVSGGPNEISIIPAASSDGSIQPAIITAGFAAGFVGLVGLHELLTSSSDEHLTSSPATD
jgi:hypothetical protein